MIQLLDVHLLTTEREKIKPKLPIVLIPTSYSLVVGKNWKTQSTFKNFAELGHKFTKIPGCAS